MNMEAHLAMARHQRAVAEFEKDRMEKLLHSKEVELARATLGFRQEVNRLYGKLLSYGWEGQIRNELIPYVNPTSNDDDPTSTADPQLQSKTIEDLKKEVKSQRELSGLAGSMLNGIAESLIGESGGLNNSSWHLVETDDGGWEFKRTDVASTSTAMAMPKGPTPPSSKSPPGGEPKRKSEDVQLPSTSSTALSFQREAHSDADDEDDDKEKKPIVSTKGDIDEGDGALSPNSSSSESLFSVVMVTTTKKKLSGTGVTSLPNPGANSKAKVKIEGELRKKVFQKSSVAPSASTSFSQTKTKTSTSFRPNRPPPPKGKHGVANQAELLCICGRNFTTKQGMTHHINYCNGSKPDLKCDLCGGPFSNKGLLTIHMTRTHGQASDNQRARVPVKQLRRRYSRESK